MLCVFSARFVPLQSSASGRRHGCTARAVNAESAEGPNTRREQTFLLCEFGGVAASSSNRHGTDTRGANRCCFRLLQ